MNKKNKYSVLMSVYKKDSPEYLQIALKSIYEQQSIKPDEIVIVVDGPIPENLRKVLDSFKKDKEKIVKIIQQEQNKGLGEALKKGTEYCTGDYIFRMDSDDISVFDRFEKQINYIEKHSNIDVLGGNIAEFQKSIDEENKRLRVCPMNHEDIVKMGKKRNPMNHVTVCIKKEALVNSGGYQSLLYLEDYYLWLRMIVNNCKLENLNETLVLVRVGNGFEGRRSTKKYIEGWKTLQNFMKKNKMINFIEAKLNMIYIRVFVSTPPWLKKIIYKFILRKTDNI
mgnify:FL=1